LERFRHEIRIGVEQIERGEVFDADEVFEELLKTLSARDEAGV
jgi:predicted transcriptional regulator